MVWLSLRNELEELGQYFAKRLSLSRHLRGPAGLSQGFPMAASTCHPESTEPPIQVCQVRGRSCDVEDGATWT